MAFNSSRYPFIGVGTGGWGGYSPLNILLCVRELTVIKD